MIHLITIWLSGARLVAGALPQVFKGYQATGVLGLGQRPLLAASLFPCRI